MIMEVRVFLKLWVFVNIAVFAIAWPLLNMIGHLIKRPHFTMVANAVVKKVLRINVVAEIIACIVLFVMLIIYGCFYP